MGSMMAKSCRGHRPLNLEIGFEAGRGSRDVLGRAYERLLPLLARSPSPSAQATLAKGARYDNPAFESGFSSSRLQVAIYARVSSDQQAERHTIDSQIAELKARALQDGYQVREDMLFIDNGHSGASLIRP